MTAGYAGKPLVAKLGIKPRCRALIAGAPRGYRKTLGPLPAGVTTRASGAGPFDFMQFFARSGGELAQNLPKLKRSLAQDGMLWIAWPKRASHVPTDLDENIVRDVGLSVGLVDVKVCAVDDTWSALKFVIPLKSRSR